MQHEERSAANREVLPIPTGRLASVTIFTENAKSSRLLVKRQKARNSSNVILCHTEHFGLVQCCISTVMPVQQSLSMDCPSGQTWYLKVNI